MKKSIALLFSFVVFSCSITFAQQNMSNSVTQDIKTIHYYSFEAKNADQNSLNNLEEVLGRMDFVTQAKVKYKPENGMGQVILLVTQPIITSERQTEFQPTAIKKTLINLGFMPIQYSKEPYVVK